MNNKIMEVSLEELAALKEKFESYNKYRSAKTLLEKGVTARREERIDLEQQLDKKMAGEGLGK